MRAKRVNTDEQYRLIMECRSSGLSDYQWCQEHGIRVGTFYNWVSRLRARGYSNIPSTLNKVSQHSSTAQEVVKIDFSQPTVVDFGSKDLVVDSIEVAHPKISLELVLGDANLRISNDADPKLLAQTIRILKELSC